MIDILCKFLNIFFYFTVHGYRINEFGKIKFWEYKKPVVINGKQMLNCRNPHDFQSSYKPILKMTQRVHEGGEFLRTVDLAVQKTQERHKYLPYPPVVKKLRFAETVKLGDGSVMRPLKKKDVSESVKPFKKRAIINPFPSAFDGVNAELNNLPQPIPSHPRYEDESNNEDDST